MDKIKNLYKHPHGLKKFIVLLIIFFAYAIFVMFKFGVADGLAVTLLTWAFFVTCTPIADAGFILDFPIRLVTGLKMLYSEIIVWVLAIIIILYNLSFNSDVFESFEVLSIFKEIVTTPWPLWGIVIVSGIGTFLSIYIADQIYSMVQAKRHHKHIQKMQLRRLFVEVIMFITVLGIYFMMLSLTHISIG